VELEEELKNGKSYSKIAEELNISMTTVKKRCEKLGLVSLNKFRRFTGV
jgi:DNA-binding NarL/FixJ family response regulator